jgi:hypothetical protein
VLINMLPHVSRPELLCAEQSACMTTPQLALSTSACQLKQWLAHIGTTLDTLTTCHAVLLASS